MELLTPGIGLLLWLIILFVMVPALTVVHLMRRKMPGSDKVLWIFLIVCVPVIGIVVYFVAYYTIHKFQR